jgi:hypothetical protein
VCDGETGFVLPVDDADSWVEKTIEIIDMKKNRPELYIEMREKARLTRKQYGTWYEALLKNAGLAQEVEEPENELAAVL